MFWFHKDEERYRKWVQNSRWDDLGTFPIQKLCHYQMCSEHFEDSQFMNKETKTKLIWNAIPTLFDVPNPPSKVTPSQPIKTWLMMSTMKKSSVKSTEQPVDILQDLPSTSKQSQVCDTPQKRRLKQKIQTLRTKLCRKQQFTMPRNKDTNDLLVAQLKQYLSVETVNFIERQIMLHHSKMFQHRCAINHFVHIIVHQLLHTLHHSTHIRTPYVVQHSIDHLMVRTLASLA